MVRYASIVIGFMVALVTGANAEDLTGPVRVIDGATVEIGGKRVKLYGIDAPDLDQTCELRGRTYRCGRVSRTALMDLVAGAIVRCIPRGKSGGSTVLANCLAGGYDISTGMVHTGWAMAMPRGGTKYAGIEREAKKRRRGLWKGKFVMPWRWREGKRTPKP